MKRYSFQDTIMLVNGVEITGWAEGDDVIDIQRRNDSISDQVGASGEMMISVSADKSGEITIKLQQTSSSNKYLMGLMALQESAIASTFVPCALSFLDTYRQDLGAGVLGYIKKPSGLTRGTAGNTQEWQFVVERLDIAFGDKGLLPI